MLTIAYASESTGATTRSTIRRMSAFQSHEIPLKPGMVDFLEDVVKTYQLTDAGKAVRCLINYARENADKRNEIFSEVRCIDC